MVRSSFHHGVGYASLQKRARGCCLVWLACSGILNKRIVVPLTTIRNMVPFGKWRDGGSGAWSASTADPGPQPRGSGPTPGVTRRRCWTRPPRLSSLPALMCPCATSPPGAGLGRAPFYRHFPTRADLIVAVYRHQVEACAEAGPALLANSSTPHAALTRWVGLFVDFLTTKHGLAAALQSDSARFETLHAYFLDRLVPVCAQLLDAAVAAGEIRPDVDAHGLLRAIGNLCVGGDGDAHYDARGMVELLIAGLLQSRPANP